jgi:hypothetical protein
VQGKVHGGIDETGEQELAVSIDLPRVSSDLDDIALSNRCNT